MNDTNIVPFCTDEQFEQIMESDAPLAKQFQHILFHEVLPTIRRTGRYNGSPELRALIAAAIKEANQLGPPAPMTGDQRMARCFDQLIRDGDIKEVDLDQLE